MSMRGHHLHLGAGTMEMMLTHGQDASPLEDIGIHLPAHPATSQSTDRLATSRGTVCGPSNSAYVTA